MIDSASPTKSNRLTASGRVPGTTRRIVVTATTPTGRLIQKTDDHE